MSIEALYNILIDFDIIEDGKNLFKIYQGLSSVRNSLLFVLIYDIKTETSLNLSLINFLQEKINKTEYKIGVLLEDPYTNLKLDIVQRDFPDADMQKLFENAHTINERKYSIYDTLIRCIHEFDDNSSNNTVVLIITETRDIVGASQVNDLDIFQIKNIQLIVIY